MKLIRITGIPDGGIHRFIMIGEHKTIAGFVLPGIQHRDANGVSAGKVAFQMLDYATVLAFLNWLETKRNCSAATRNVRLAALSSFAAYAQNRNTDAALVFLRQ